MAAAALTQPTERRQQLATKQRHHQTRTTPSITHHNRLSSQPILILTLSHSPATGRRRRPTAIDREWYDQDEENAVASDDTTHAFPAPAIDTDASSTRRQARKLTARSQQVTRDNNAWEESRMFQSGVVTATTVDTDFSSAETEKKVQLVVHEMKPPFLDGRTVYTRQGEYGECGQGRDERLGDDSQEG